MYEFKYKINDHQRFNSYEITIQKDKNQSTPYQIIRNSLLFIIFLLTIFIIGAFIKKSYQEYKKRVYLKHIIIKEIKDKSLNDLTLNEVITKSVINNLEANNQTKTVNYNELKLIIKQIVNKIKDESKAKK